MNDYSPRHLLVVASNDAFRTDVTDMLRFLTGVQLHQATDICDAWYKINDESIDLVLVDEKLSDGTGAELLQKIKWSEEFASTDFLMFFDSEDEENIAVAMELHASDYAVKPVTADVLFFKLEQLYGESLGVSQAMEALKSQGAEDTSRQKNVSRKEAPSTASEVSRQVASGGDELRTFFQPVLDVGQRRIYGFEALTRGSNNGTGTVSPALLFADLPPEETVALDLRCREQALASFAKLLRADPSYCLHLNISRPTVEQCAGGAAGLPDVVEAVGRLGVDGSQIILELDEAEKADFCRLEAFIKANRSHGFRIAFDRYDDGRMSLSRVVELHPDMVKITGSLVGRAASGDGAGQVVRALVDLAGSVGTQVAATGIENEEDALALLRMGVRVMQGFYFDKPHSTNIRGMEKYNFLVEHVAREYMRFRLESISGEKRRQAEAHALLQKVVAALARSGVEKYPAVLQAALRRDRALMRAFVLDRKGVQLLDAVCQDAQAGSGTAIPPRGMRHFLSDYYLHVAAGYKRFVTPPHVSPFSGDMSQIMAHRVPGESRHIVCIELNMDD